MRRIEHPDRNAADNSGTGTAKHRLRTMAILARSVRVGSAGPAFELDGWLCSPSGCGLGYGPDSVGCPGRSLTTRTSMKPGEAYPSRHRPCVPLAGRALRAVAVAPNIRRARDRSRSARPVRVGRSGRMARRNTMRQGRGRGARVGRGGACRILIEFARSATPVRQARARPQPSPASGRPETRWGRPLG